MAGPKVKEEIVDGKKAENKVVLDLTVEFLSAVMKRKDWHPYAQLRTRKAKTPPSIPAYSDFKVIRTHNAGGGMDPDVTKAVFVNLTLGGNDRLRLQVVSGRLLAVKECEWDPCPTCEGAGVTEGDVRCIPCLGNGKRKVEPPRIPTKGTKTYQYDLENGEWGVCPTSFSFIADSARMVV